MRAVTTVFLPVLVAYAATLVWCWDSWFHEGSYWAHGPLVPIAMLVAIWARRAQWSIHEAAPDRRALWLLAPALLLHLVGAALTVDSLSAASTVLALPGAAWLALGRARLRGLWPVLWMWGLAVPLPIFVTGRLTFELKELAVGGAVWLANATGLGVVRLAAELRIPGQSQGLEVADPCGGLRSLVAMLTLAYALAFLLGAPIWRRRLGLLLLAAPVAVLVNILRITGICWVGKWFGTGFAAGTGHDLVNILTWALDLAALLGIDALLSRHVATPRAEPEPPRALPPPLKLVPVALWVVSLPLLFLCCYRPYGESRGRAEAMPTTVAGFTLQDAHRIVPRYRELLGTDDAIWRTYRADGGEPVFVVMVFHGHNWKSVHPPHMCIAGSDMVIQEDGLREAEVGGRKVQLGFILASQSQPGRAARPYVSLFAFGARGFCTGSYWQFVLHHAPRALVRSSNDGFLLRVESYADGAGGVAAAEQRCLQLLNELYRSGESILP